MKKKWLAHQINEEKNESFSKLVFGLLVDILHFEMIPELLTNKEQIQIKMGLIILAIGANISQQKPLAISWMAIIWYKNN